MHVGDTLHTSQAVVILLYIFFTAQNKMVVRDHRVNQAWLTLRETELFPQLL